MIALSALTSRELAQVDSAISEMEAALELLLDRGMCSESGGVDLEELSEAVAVELEQREAVA